jgi:hypothetical protein
MKAIAYRKQQLAVAVALSFIAAGVAAPSISQAGNVRSGETAVSNSLGRSSTSHAAGGSISASGQSHQVIGRGNGSTHDGASRRVATMDGGYPVNAAGRGSAPSFARQTVDAATTVASNR